MDPAALYAFIAEQDYAVVATTGPDATPQSALVGIAVTPACELIFDTRRSSRKYPNLIARPACSLVLGWSGEQTLQPVRRSRNAATLSQPCRIGEYGNRAGARKAASAVLKSHNDNKR